MQIAYDCMLKRTYLMLSSALFFVAYFLPWNMKTKKLKTKIL